MGSRDDTAASTHDSRVRGVITVIDEANAELRLLFDRFYTGYNAAFQNGSAAIALARWSKRHCARLGEAVNIDESGELQRLVPRRLRRDSWRFREHCESIGTFLDELADQVLSHPEDFFSA